MSNPYAPPEDRPRADVTGTGSTGTGSTGTDGAADRGGADDGEQRSGARGPAPRGAHEHAPQAPRPEHWPPPGPPVGRAGRTGAFGAVPDVRPPAPEDLADVLSRTRGAAVLGLAGVLLLLLPMPWVLTSLPFAVGAVVQAVRALRVARRTRVVGPPRTTLGLLVVLSAGAVLMTLLNAALWPIQAPYTRCHQAALTVQAQQACTTQFEDRLGQLRGSGS